MRILIVVFFVLNSLSSFSQKQDTTLIHFTGSYSNGLCGLLQNNHSQNTYYNKIYTQLSIGARKDFFKEKAFGELQIGYYNLGTRMQVASGNSFLPPDLTFVYHNHYASLVATVGFYIKKSIYLKEALGFDFLVASDQYDVNNMHSFRGLYRFTPTFETSIGFDFNFLTKINGYIEWFAGITFLKPIYIYTGPKIGFYFKEKEIMPGYF